jgi:hypothetical protein
VIGVPTTMPKKPPTGEKRVLEVLGPTPLSVTAGTLGVGVAEALVARGTVALKDGNYVLTGSGAGAPGFAALGLDVAAVRAEAERRRRPLARACLDWSERRYHLAGALGAALTLSLLEHEWVERVRGTRALRVTNGGRRALARHFGVQVW